MTIIAYPNLVKNFKNILFILLATCSVFITKAHSSYYTQSGQSSNITYTRYSNGVYLYQYPAYYATYMQNLFYYYPSSNYTTGYIQKKGTPYMYLVYYPYNRIYTSYKPTSTSYTPYSCIANNNGSLIQRIKITNATQVCIRPVIGNKISPISQKVIFPANTVCKFVINSYSQSNLTYFLYNNTFYLVTNDKNCNLTYIPDKTNNCPPLNNYLIGATSVNKTTTSSEKCLVFSYNNDFTMVASAIPSKKNIPAGTCVYTTSNDTQLIKLDNDGYYTLLPDDECDDTARSNCPLIDEIPNRAIIGTRAIELTLIDQAPKINSEGTVVCALKGRLNTQDALVFPQDSSFQSITLPGGTCEYILENNILGSENGPTSIIYDKGDYYLVSSDTCN